MNVDFALVWHAIRWDDFVPTRLLTIQFLCNLWEVDDSVSCQLFGNEYYLTSKTLSHHIDFNACRLVSLDQACRALISMIFEA
jgi:hypothetical protein